MDGPTSERAILARRHLNWGIAAEPVAPGLDIALDVVLARVADGRTLGLVEGIDALAQDLRVALLTAHGADPFDTDFGFDGIDAMAEEIDPFLLRERIRVAVIRVLQRDPRVRRVTDVRLEDSAAGRTLEVTVGFETVAGEAATINLGRITGSE